MDSPAQVDGGSSKPFWMIRFKNVIYNQKMFPRKLAHPKMFRNRRPDHILACFLHHSEFKNHAQTAKTLRIIRKPENKTQIDPQKF